MRKRAFRSSGNHQSLIQVPVFRLPDQEIVFPHPSLAEPTGILAFGGDLSPERIILAYQNGIFPWYDHGEDIAWWCLTPRLMLIPSGVSISKSMRSLINRSAFQISFDKCFLEVMQACRTIHRKGQRGSWIHYDIMEAFLKLHQLGLAHSVEVWQSGSMVGGLYGLALGKMFCGESMFAKVPNASKYGLISLCKLLQKKEFDRIDCQQDTPHLTSMGADLYGREEFFQFLEQNKQFPLVQESWLAHSEPECV